MTVVYFYWKFVFLESFLNDISHNLSFLTPILYLMLCDTVVTYVWLPSMLRCDFIYWLPFNGTNLKFINVFVPRNENLLLSLSRLYDKTMIKVLRWLFLDHFGILMNAFLTGWIFSKNWLESWTKPLYVYQVKFP